jgi:hypothetical protein
MPQPAMRIRWRDRGQDLCDRVTLSGITFRLMS